MKKWGWFLVLYIAVILVSVGGAHLASEVVTVFQQTRPLDREVCVIIDAGHGGEDGGASSCTGMLESQINLEISLRLNDLLHLLGYQTRMIRTTDTAIYTEGETLSAKKVSDLKNRVTIVNQTENGLLVSIHQNTFPDGRYSGAQVFYGKDSVRKQLADHLQTSMIKNLNPGSKRRAKPSDGIYLMQHIQRPGILVECGFISNVEEDAKLRSADYQQKVVCVIATEVAQFCTLDP